MQDDNCAMPSPYEACGKVVTAIAPREIWPISGRQRQFLAPLGKRLDQGADAYAGLRAHGVFAEFQDSIEPAGVDRRAAVTAHAAGLRIVGADHAHGRGIALGLFKKTRKIFETFQTQHKPRPPINAR